LKLKYKFNFNVQTKRSLKSIISHSRVTSTV